VALAIIAAGGRGSRLGSHSAKFEQLLCGKPLIMYSLEAFQAARSIEGIALVVPRDRLSRWTAEKLRDMGISKAVSTVAGGATRQQSVFLGLKQLGDVEGVVVVHDAARPCVTSAMIEIACDIPEGADGLITASDVTDTIKMAHGGFVESTPERDRLVAVQTPQAFYAEVLRTAHHEAEVEGFEGTDDAALVERAGGRVALLQGSRDNIKVTYADDLTRAEAIIVERSTP
jgi:2-C-methyl-D-erythritol 4-phosphate cytidylyltransferase